MASPIQPPMSSTVAAGTAEILSQIRSFQAEIQSTPAAAASTGIPGGFGAALTRAVGEVNQVQQQAGALAVAFERGDPGVELAEVMIANQKAGLAFRTIGEVRNHLIQAYQEVMNMPV